MTDAPRADGGIERQTPDGPPQLRYERDPAEPPSEAVVRAVAGLTGRDPLELDPLYDVVDPDTLDGLLQGRSNEQFSAEIALEYGGCAVTVTTDTVRVHRVDG